MADDKVTLNITASQTVQYNQEVTIDRKDFERLQRAFASPRYRSEGEDLVADLLDYRDVDDAHSFEIDELTILDEDGTEIGMLLEDGSIENYDTEEEEDDEDSMDDENE